MQWTKQEEDNNDTNNKGYKYVRARHSNLLILTVNILGSCYSCYSHSVDEELRHGEQVAESQCKLKQFDSRA